MKPLRHSIFTILVALAALAACVDGGSPSDSPADGSLVSGVDTDTMAGPRPPRDITRPAADSTADSTTGVTTGVPHTTKTDYLFDDLAPPRHIHLTVAPEDWRWLQDNATLEQYVPASVELDGRQMDDAAVRYKGAYGSLYSCFTPEGERTCPKLSIKLSFNERRPGGRFYGVRKFILNACGRDATCLRERLSYALFRAAGVPASRAVHALVSVNDGPPSFYLLVESVDRELLEERFADPSGNLYKEAWPQSLTPQRYLAALKTNESDADVGRLIELARLLQSVDDTTFNSALDPWIDRELTARYLAVDQITNNWDGVWKFYCRGDACGNHNYYLYDDPSSGRFVLLPWDLDNTFNRPNRDMARSWWDDSPDACQVRQVSAMASVRAPQCDTLLRGLMLDSWDLYREGLSELVAEPDGPLALSHVLALLDRYRAMLLPLAERDPLGPGLDVWRRASAELRQIIIEQYAEIDRFLSEQSIARESR